MDGAGIEPSTSQLRGHDSTAEPQSSRSNSGMAASGEELTEPKRIVILGKTGSGKSSLVNTIFGRTLFTAGHTSESETRKCQAETRSVNGRCFTLVDTPGLFDTETPEDLKPEIIKCMTLCAPGPHAFLILLKVEKFGEHEKAVINEIQALFSKEAFKYATVVFTHGDQLQKGQTIEDFVGDTSLSDVVKKCGGRCHVIDSKYWNEETNDEYRSNKFQVEQLLKTIDKMIEDNNGGYYTNKMLQAVERMMTRVREIISEVSRNLPTEIVRTIDIDVVQGELRTVLSGVPTRMLLAVFLGAVMLLVVALVERRIGNVTALRAAVIAVAGNYMTQR